jgi:predicted alpha/beta-hydrolase family hydrolase
MNWITLAVVGAVAAWFEYNYQRSRRRKADQPELSTPAASKKTRNEVPGAQPSVVPGDKTTHQ